MHGPPRETGTMGCVLAFFSFFHLGEFLLTSQSQFNPRLHLSWGGMAVNNQKAPSMLKFHLYQSKTDPVGHGVDVVLGKTGCNLCPVVAVLSYVSAWGSRQQGPFFITSTGRPLLNAEI